MPAPLNSSDFVSAFAALSDQLACPACHGELRMEAGQLICVQCGVAYPIVDGIPVFTAGTREE